MSLGILDGRPSLGAIVANDDCRAFQTKLNGILVPQGFQALTVDGKCGASTCGAAAEAAKTVPSIKNEFGFNLPAVCPSSTPPRKSGGGFGPTTTLTQPVEASSGGFMDNQTILLICGIGLAAYAFFGTQK